MWPLAFHRVRGMFEVALAAPRGRHWWRRSGRSAPSPPAPRPPIRDPTALPAEFGPGLPPPSIIRFAAEPQRIDRPAQDPLRQVAHRRKVDDREPRASGASVWKLTPGASRPASARRVPRPGSGNAARNWLTRSRPSWVRMSPPATPPAVPAEGQHSRQSNIVYCCPAGPGVRGLWQSCRNCDFFLPAGLGRGSNRLAPWAMAKRRSFRQDGPDGEIGAVERLAREALDRVDPDVLKRDRHGAEVIAARAHSVSIARRPAIKGGAVAA